VSTRAPSLQTELLLSAAVLGVGALVLVTATALLAPLFGEGWRGAGLLTALIAADVIIFVAFGWHLVSSRILRPVSALGATAEAVAAGDLSRRAPPGGTIELDQLAQSLNRMTERLLDAQGALVRAEKLASVGRLAAGIAHEVGNPLSAIGNYVSVLQRRGADREIVEAIERETGRIDGIVRSLLAYARPREVRREPLGLGELAAGAVELLRAQGLLHDTAIRLEADPTSPRVLGDRAALEQVVVNLLLNALDATSAAASGARIVVAIAPTMLGGTDRARRSTDGGAAPVPPPTRADRRSGRHLPGTPDGTRAAQLIVADNGPGVPPEIADRIFDPFFTTKEPGKGTGLGLAIVHSIVEHHGGRVDVARAREGGAAFLVTLPPAA